MNAVRRPKTHKTMPFVTSSSLFLVVQPGATSIFLLLVAMPFVTTKIYQNASKCLKSSLRVHYAMIKLLFIECECVCSFWFLEVGILTWLTVQCCGCCRPLKPNQGAAASVLWWAVMLRLLAGFVVPCLPRLLAMMPIYIYLVVTCCDSVTPTSKYSALTLHSGFGSQSQGTLGIQV